MLLRTASYPYPNRHSARATFPWRPFKTASIKIHRFAKRVHSTNLGEFNEGLLDYSLHRITISINELTKISEFADQQEGNSKMKRRTQGICGSCGSGCLVRLRSFWTTGFRMLLCATCEKLFPLNKL
ncbi:MAG TPA: hypothetical protein DCK93_21180 [Blastocatellia bacterium]|nr:hypothetical protein [Blastocatellia bacterium]